MKPAAHAGEQNRRLIMCQTPSKTQTDKETNGQTPGIEFGAFSLKM